METIRRKNWRKRLLILKEQYVFYLMMLPGLAYLFINNYLPMFGILIAFKRVNFSVGVLKSPGCGLSNFEYLFATKDAGIILRNTIGYNTVWLVIGTIGAVFIALLMVEIAAGKLAKLIQPVICFPNVISTAIVAYIVFAFLSPSNGFINNTILNGESVRWYSEAKYWPYILTITYIWKNVGYMSIIYMAAIAGIDKTVFEAAKLDGAGKLEQIWYITLPMIRGTIIFTLILSIGRIMYSDFGLFYQVPMNSGLLFNTTQTIDTYVYRALIELRDIGMSSAASVFQAIVGFALVATTNGIVRKINPDYALF